MDPATIISQFVSWAQNLAEVWGYLGIFVVNLVSSASIIFPIPGIAIVFLFGGILNPWLVGVSAGIGAAFGELTGYGVGFGGKKVIERKYGKWLERTKKWMERYKAFVLIFLFAATPLPHDVLGLLCGAVNYDIKKFFLATLAGKILINLVVAWAGFYGIHVALEFLGNV